MFVLNPIREIFRQVPKRRLFVEDEIEVPSSFVVPAPRSLYHNTGSGQHYEESHHWEEQETTAWGTAWFPACSVFKSGCWLKVREVEVLLRGRSQVHNCVSKHKVSVQENTNIGEMMIKSISTWSFLRFGSSKCREALWSFRRWGQSTLALAVYQLKLWSCNVLDVGRKIFALSWSYSKAWLHGSSWFPKWSESISTYFKVGSFLSFDVVCSFWTFLTQLCTSGTGDSSRRKLVGANRTIQECLGRQNAVSVVSDSPTVSFRGRFLLEVLGACHGKKSLYAAISKSKVGSLRVSSTKFESQIVSWCFMMHLTFTVEKTFSFARPGRAIPLPEFEAWFKSSLEGFNMFLSLF